MIPNFSRRTIAALFVTALVAGCGSSSSNNTPPPPPSATDLLAGAGGFQATADQAQWGVNAPAGATLTQEFASCNGSTCIKLGLADADWNSVSNAWDFQLYFLDPTAATPTAKNVTLRGDKQYVLKFWGKAVNPADPAGTTHAVQFELQKADQGSVIIPGNNSVELSADGTSWESDPFTYGATDDATAEFTVKINLGPGTDNAGTTFYFDDIQVLESPKPPPPSGTDILGGLGSFETDPSGNWYKNISAGATNQPATKDSVTVAFSACPAGSGTGTCAVLSSTDTTNGFGKKKWYSQLIYGASGTPTAIVLDPNKKYRIALKGMVQGCTAPVTIVSWLQPDTDDSSKNWPPANNNNWNLVLTDTMKDVTTSVFQGAVPSDPTIDGWRLNFSFGTDSGDASGSAGGTGNVGCTFTLDDIQLIQIN